MAAFAKAHMLKGHFKALQAPCQSPDATVGCGARETPHELTHPGALPPADRPRSVTIVQIIPWAAIIALLAMLLFQQFATVMLRLRRQVRCRGVVHRMCTALVTTAERGGGDDRHDQSIDEGGAAVPIPMALKGELDRLHVKFCTAAFIATDPIQIPHRFTEKADIEIMGFLAALLSFGSRRSFLPKLHHLCDVIALSAPSPFAFIQEYGPQLPPSLTAFRYRYFTALHLHDVFRFLQQAYACHGGLHGIAVAAYRGTGDVLGILQGLRAAFLASQPQHPHSVWFVGNPKTSACKKLNMFLRWMVRQDAVDFGLWPEISPAHLLLPLDVHSFAACQQFGLLRRPLQGCHVPGTEGSPTHIAGLHRPFAPAPCAVPLWR
eukprot:GGOE01046000.1.p1 GENE.GGOE01046000.1~~GGOE01046000.1.p1  ORF type:complete len:378 (+),score=64.29 GGOE01046000.1:74-1207(+)